MPRLGRPPLPSSLVRSKMLNVPVSPREMRAFKRYAKRVKMHVATIARQHVLDAAAKYGIIP